MKAFYSILVLVAALLVAQLIFTSKAFAETKNVWTTSEEVERVSKGWDYVEETFETPYDYVTRCWGKTGKDAKDLAYMFQYKAEKGYNVSLVWDTERDDEVATLVVNKDGTFTTRRYHKSHD